jgi:hypothetical protein
MNQENYPRKNFRDDENRQREGRDATQRGGRWNEWNEQREDGSSRQDPAMRREDDEDRYYRGYYSRSHAPFRTSRGGYGDLLVESWTLSGPYTGRGPKGYRRSDEQILEEACRRLEQDGAIDARDIEVSCESGIVRLKGEVEDRRAKRLAEDCVESVYGVRDVMNELRVRPEPGNRDDENSASETGGASGRKSKPERRG